jgi:hypothetical protein
MAHDPKNTFSPADLRTVQRMICAHTGLNPNAVGMIGNAAHKGGYHRGRDDLREFGVLNSDYSVETARDKRGLSNAASALDIGYRWPKTDWRHDNNAAWLRFNAFCLADIRSHHPAWTVCRAMNFSPDGVKKKRIDPFRSMDIIKSTDTVDVHTHFEFWRDTEGQRAGAFKDRLEQLIIAAITNTTPQEGDMTPDEHNFLFALGNRVRAGVLHGLPQLNDTPGDGPNQRVWLVDQINALVAGQAASAQRETALAAAIQALAGDRGVDTTAVIDAVNKAAQGQSATVQGLQQQLADVQRQLLELQQQG